jgi:hypothetical protein
MSERDKSWDEMSTFDKVVNVGFVILFTIAMTLAVIGHVMMEIRGYDDTGIVWIW